MLQSQRQAVAAQNSLKPRAWRRARRSRVLARAAPHHLNVVITGGSKGLGFAMTHEFLQAGDGVVICSRDGKRLTAALRHLQQHSAIRPQQVHGIACDVSAAGDVQRLAEFAADRLGLVHRWINNAGQVTQTKLLHEISPADIQNVVNSNVLGSLLCSRAAIQLMQQQHTQLYQHQRQAQQQQQQQWQHPQYHIFNMGFSQWGARFSKSACTHKMTKMSLTQLNKSLAEELVEAGLGYIGVHNLSPGMVLTDLLLQGASPVARRFFNVLAEEPETVAAVLVPRVRAVQGTGSSIDYLSPAAAVGRVLTGGPQILNGGRFFDKDGNRVCSNSKVGSDQKAAAVVSARAAAAAVATPVVGSTVGAQVFNSAGVKLLYDYPVDEY